METQFIKLNMTPTGINPCFHVSQYDIGRSLGFMIYNGSEVVDLDSYTCTIEATRSDGVAITASVATDDNVGTFEITATMTNKSDKYKAQFVIVDGNSNRIASLPFDMDVCKAAMDENSESIEEDASLYQQYTEAVQGAIAEANADIQAEENARIAAVNAEATTRANADTTLQNNIDAEATARANAITAEATARQTADNTLQGNINSEASARASADSNLQSQINQIIAPSGEAPSAAEVQNARIGADGVTYGTLGDAIRTQVASVNGDSKTQGLMYVNVNKLTHVHYTNGAYRYFATGEVRVNSDYSYSDYIQVIPLSHITFEDISNPHTTFYGADYAFISGTLNTEFNVPSNAVYMIVSMPISNQSSAKAYWNDNRLTVVPDFINDSNFEFNNAEWNKVYTFNVNSFSGTGHNPSTNNGTLFTLDTTATHYAAKQIYIDINGCAYSRFYIPSTSQFTEWSSSLGQYGSGFKVGTDYFTDVDNAPWNKWIAINLSDANLLELQNLPCLENGLLITYDTTKIDSDTAHFAGRQVYISVSGEVFNRYYIPSTQSFTEWMSTKKNDLKKNGVLYDKYCTSSNASDFVGGFTATSSGFIISTKAILGRFYSIENRTTFFLCKLFSDSVVVFGTYPYTDVNTANTSLFVNVSDKTIKLNTFDSETCSFLSEGVYSVELTKNYQSLKIRITKMTSGEVFTKEYVNNGTGGVGEGAQGVANNVPMQYDYPGCNKVSGTDIILIKINVFCEQADVVLYGDSISEPEAYYPTDDFSKSWTQLLINNSSLKIVTSGRSGTTITKIKERIKWELPFINAKYCVITIGTNGGNTVENLTEIVNYIKKLGVVPILNHIPCFDNNGDTTGFFTINQMIDTVRQNTSIKGCDFDKCTSLNYDGQSLNPDTMYLETYSGGATYRHHPNTLGSAAMFAQLKNDLPELF